MNTNFSKQDIRMAHEHTKNTLNINESGKLRK